MYVKQYLASTAYNKTLDSVTTNYGAKTTQCVGNQNIKYSETIKYRSWIKNNASVEFQQPLSNSNHLKTYLSKCISFLTILWI